MKTLKNGEVFCTCRLEEPIMLNVNSVQFDVQIQYDPIQNTSKVFSTYWQTDLKIYKKRQRTKYQHETEEQSCNTHHAISRFTVSQQHSRKYGIDERIDSYINVTKLSRNNPHRYSQLIFDKGTKETQWKRRVFSKKDSDNLTQKLTYSRDLNVKWKIIKLLKENRITPI